MSIVITKNMKRDTGENTFCLFGRQKHFQEVKKLILIIVTENTAGASYVRVYMFVFCRGIPVNVVTTPWGSLDRKFASLSYRNRTVFDRTSGTEQMHPSNKCDTLCTEIAVTRTDSIPLVRTVVVSILSQTNPVDIPLPKALM